MLSRLSHLASTSVVVRVYVVVVFHHRRKTASFSSVRFVVHRRVVPVAPCCRSFHRILAHTRWLSVDVSSLSGRSAPKQGTSGTGVMKGVWDRRDERCVFRMNDMALLSLRPISMVLYSTKIAIIYFECLGAQASLTRDALGRW